MLTTVMVGDVCYRFFLFFAEKMYQQPERAPEAAKETPKDIPREHQLAQTCPRAPQEATKRVPRAATSCKRLAGAAEHYKSCRVALQEA